MGIGAAAVFLLVPLGLAALFSVVGLFAAFFNRTFARACAAFSLTLVACFAVLVLLANGGNVGWLLHLFFSVSPPIVGLVHGSVLLALIAAFAPLQHRDSATGKPDSGQPRWTIFGCVCAVALALAGCGIWQWNSSRLGEQKARALLAGDSNIHLERFSIEYQQRRVLCTDPEVLRYLEERFRQVGPAPQGLGMTYELSLSFDGGGSFSLGTYWGDKADAVVLRLPEDEDFPPRYGLLFTAPRPRAFDQMLAFLRADSRQDGTVLIMAPGGIRVEHDESLRAR